MSEQPPAKRARKLSSALGTSSPRPSISRQSSQPPHPHPLRQTTYSRDLQTGSEGHSDSVEAKSDEGRDEDEDGYDEQIGVTRQMNHKDDADEDEEDEEDDEDNSIFSSIKLKIRVNGYSKDSKHKASSNNNTDNLESGEQTAEESAEADVDWNNMFPPPSFYGLDVNFDGPDQTTGDEQQDIDALLGEDRLKRKRTFYPGMSQEDLRKLISSFTEDQMERYETFRRANVNRGGVKKLANAVLNQSIADNVAMAISGFSKVFLGEVVERALDVQQRMDPPDPLNPYAVAGPLQSEHIREAWRLYRQETGLVPAAHWRRQGGRGDGRMFR
ncbi:hTAFII28-like protein conserved region-domain-containing protein [Lipomyces arxii]|uniref:hTAFII28-like protein conserved region-domain-containing protein n=1 Tax=Lipomyces arxii TaxID=56418 RepID=UPI0034CE368E